MKPFIKYFILCFFAGCCCFGHANSLEATFEEGNRLYTTQKYEEAIKKYNEILDASYESFGTYFNLGNAHYRIGNYKQAVLFYEKALKLQPNDEATLHNIRQTQLKFQDKIEAIPQIFLFTFWQNIYSSMGTTAWAVLFIVSLFLIAGTTLLFNKANQYKTKKICFFSDLFLLLVSVFLLSCSISSYAKQNEEYAIIWNVESAIKSSPENYGKTKFVLHEGCKVKILDYIPPFYKISVADGNSGWINESEIKKI